MNYEFSDYIYKDIFKRMYKTGEKYNLMLNYMSIRYLIITISLLMFILFSLIRIIKFLNIYKFFEYWFNNNKKLTVESKIIILFFGVIVIFVSSVMICECIQKFCGNIQKEFVNDLFVWGLVVNLICNYIIIFKHPLLKLSFLVMIIFFTMFIVIVLFLMKIDKYRQSKNYMYNKAIKKTSISHFSIKYQIYQELLIQENFIKDNIDTPQKYLNFINEALVKIDIFIDENKEERRIFFKILKLIIGILGFYTGYYIHSLDIKDKMFILKIVYSIGIPALIIVCTFYFLSNFYLIYQSVLVKNYYKYPKVKKELLYIQKELQDYLKNQEIEKYIL